MLIHVIVSPSDRFAVEKPLYFGPEAPSFVNLAGAGVVLALRAAQRRKSQVELVEVEVKSVEEAAVDALVTLALTPISTESELARIQGTAFNEIS